MKDTRYWSSFVNNLYADQATGGITLEQFVISINSKLGKNYTAMTILDEAIEEAAYLKSGKWFLASTKYDVPSLAIHVFGYNQRCAYRLV